MRNKHIHIPILFIAASLGLPCLSQGSEPTEHNDSRYDSYLRALKIAEKKVLRARAAATAPVVPNAAIGTDFSSLSAVTPNEILGRPMRVGDTWDVAMVRTQSTMMRMTTDPRHLKTPRSRVALFRYTVKDVQSSGETTIDVTQLREEGFKPVDSRIEHLTLKMNDKTVQTEKKYFARGSEHPIPVAPDGLRSAMTPLELYPLDVPEILSAEKKAPATFPQLPEELALLRKSRASVVDLSKSIWFEQDDFFGRPVEILWQKGDPWPAYLRTHNGIAILMSKGGA
jgi:hypothetical protein